jgi:hypothetical protein
MWVLVIYAFAGGMSGTDSVALTSIRDTFKTEQVCINAGEKAKKMASGTLKEIRYTCLRDW